MPDSRFAYYVKVRALVEAGADKKEVIKAMGHREHHCDKDVAGKMYDKVLKELTELQR